MTPVSDNRIVAQLTDDLMDFLDSEVERCALGRSTIIRQSLDLRRTTNRRRAAVESEIFAVAEGVS